MKRTVLFGTMFSAALAVGMSAQTPQTGASSSAQGSDQQVTVSGCLTQGDATGTSGSGGAGATGSGATGAAGEKSTGSSRDNFMLTNAMMGTSGSSATGGAGAAGAAGAGSPTSSAGANKFKLEGGDSSDLKKFANSQVEIRGTLSNRGSSSAGAAGAAGSAGSAAGQPGASASSMNVPTLRVSSVRQISPSCK